MTGPVLTVLGLYLLAVLSIVIGVYLTVGIGPAFMMFGVASLVMAAITARGIFNA